MTGISNTTPPSKPSLSESERTAIEAAADDYWNWMIRSGLSCHAKTFWMMGAEALARIRGGEPKTNCSVHERCIWELALEGAKSNADTAIRRMEKAESRLARAVELLERAESAFGSNAGLDFQRVHDEWLADLAKHRGERK